MASDITVKEVPAIKVISIRKELTHKNIGAFLTSSAIALTEYTKETGAGLTGKGFALYHKYSDDVSDIEVCLPINKDVTGRNPIHFREIPACKAAVLHIKGSYEQLRPSHEKLQQWCTANGHKSTESREVYTKGPLETTNSTEWETEVLLVLA